MSSDISSYFKNRNDLGLEIVECIICETVLKDNLKKHLTDIHGDRFKAVEEFEIERSNIETGDLENIVETSNNELVQTKNKANVWRYFFKQMGDRWTAQCLICDGLYSFKTTTGNLSSHLKKRHPTAFVEYRKLVSGDEISFNVDGDDAKGDRSEIEGYEHKDDGEKDDDVVPGGGNDSEERGDVIYLVKSQQRQYKNNIWKFFSKFSHEEFKAQCFVCDGILSYRATTGNLRRHLEKRHPRAYKEYQKCRNLTEVDLNFADIGNIDGEKGDVRDDRENIDDVATDEVNDLQKTDNVTYLVKSQQRPHRSNIWKFFSKLSHEEFKAQCSVCDDIFSYKGTTQNLCVHLEKKHPNAYLQYLKMKNLDNEDELTSDVENADKDKTARDDTSEVEENSGKDDGEIDDDDADPDYVNDSEKKGDVIYLDQPQNRQQRGIVWNFFSKSPYANFKAQCSICDNVLSYKSTTGNLRKHIEKRHPVAFIKFMKNINSKGKEASTDDDSDEEVKVKYASDYTDDFGNLVFEEPKKRKNLSFLWKYFNKIAYENSKAQCSLCGTMLSFRTTIGNLSHHLKKRHPIAYKDYHDLKETAAKELVENKKESKKDKHEAKDQSKNGDPSETEENYDKGSETIHHNSDSEHDYDFADVLKPLRPQKKLIPSTAWRHVFKVTGNERVRCSICDTMLSYHTGWCGNLRYHLQRKHPIAYAECEKKYLNDIGEYDANDPLTVDVNDDAEREIEEFTDDFGNKIQLVKPKPRKSDSVTWRYFSKESDEEFRARCLTCGGMFSYKESTANLRDHLEKRHPKVYMEYKSVKNLVENDEDGSNGELAVEDFGNVAEHKHEKNQSHLWMFFSKLSFDIFKAQCSLCSAIISFKSSKENLLLHLLKKHPEAHRNVLELNRLTGDIAAENQDIHGFGALNGSNRLCGSQAEENLSVW